MNKQATIAALVALSISGAALAHGGAKGIVKERMDGMSAMSEAVKSFSMMMRGKLEYDASQVKLDAQSIQAHAGEQLSSLFPEGSGGMPSEAKAEIWDNWAEFENLANQLQRYAKALELAAPNGLSDGEGAQLSAKELQDLELEEFSMMSADVVFKPLARTCANCHTKFRQK